MQQARGAGEAGDDYEVTCRSYANQVFLLKYLGRTQAAMDIASEGLRALQRRALHLGVGASFVNNAIAVLFDGGRIAESAAILQDLTNSVVLQGRATYVWLLRANIALVQDDVEVARDCIERAENLRSVDDPWVICTYTQVKAESLAACGRRQEALELIEDGLQRLEGEGAGIVTQLCRVGLRVVADDPRPTGRRTGDRDVSERARKLASRLPAEAGSSMDGTLQIERRTAEAELGRALSRDEPEVWEELTTAWAAAGRPLDQSYCAFRHAVSLAECRRARPAAVAAGEARRLAASIGYLQLLGMIDELVRQARLELVEGGPKQVPATRQHPMGLSGRELEVLELLTTDGLSNREIATRLFISERTAAVHVSAVLRKLGVSNRLQAVAVAKGILGKR